MQLKNLLGRPGEGIHRHVFGLAIFDILATILAGVLLGWWEWHRTGDTSVPVLLVYVLLATGGLFVVGECLHLLIGVDTVVAKWLKEPWWEE